MKRFFSLSLALTILAICGLFSAALAQDRAIASQGGPAPIIKHGINTVGADTLSAPTGIPSTAPEFNPFSMGAARDENGGELNPGSKGFSLTTGGTGSLTPLLNHGGPVIGTPTIYIIWYGNWNRGNGTDTPAGQQIIRDFSNNVGNSAYFLMNSTYGGGISGHAVFGGETTTTGYPQGTSLTDTEVKTVANSAITSGRLPYNASGVYFVITSSDVSETSGFCSQYCGWHTAATPSAGHIRYSFVGNAARCITSCAAQSTSPNGNPGVDGLISVMAHELEEATTDPDLNAWYDSSGAENGDKCAWTFGHFQYQVGNGSWANVHMGSRDYLIQRNVRFNSNGQFCMMDATHN
ncbi:MAG TPA: hypothetical protein VGO91_05485 [Pyrinomonadaceae bacterium]|nr:hypothetical protein [Pyrinomonadaceae bacterium]